MKYICQHIKNSRQTRHLTLLLTGILMEMLVLLENLLFIH